MRNANEAAILVMIGSRLLIQIKPSAEQVLHTERLKTDKHVITWIHNSMADRRGPACCVTVAGPAQEGAEVQQLRFKKDQRKETPACSSQSSAHSENRDDKSC